MPAFLFLLVIDWIMKTTTTGRNNGIQWTLWTQLDDLDFADDLALLSHNHSQMQDKTTLLETTSAGTGLKINRKKTELMKMNTTSNAPITVGGEPIPQGKRKRGQPRNSWRRDTEAELKQQRTNWSGMTRAAQNRVRWRGGR